MQTISFVSLSTFPSCQSLNLYHQPDLNYTTVAWSLFAPSLYCSLWYRFCLAFIGIQCTTVVHGLFNYFLSCESWFSRAKPSHPDSMLYCHVSFPGTTIHKGFAGGHRSPPRQFNARPIFRSNHHRAFKFFCPT